MTVAHIAEPSRRLPADARTGGTSYTASLHDWCDPSLRAEWQQLVDESDSPGALFQSPQWFEQLNSIDPTRRLALVCLRNRQHEFAGIIAINPETDTLDYYVGKRILWRASLDMLSITGGGLILPPNRGAYDEAFAALYDRLANFDCVRLNAVRTDSYLWAYVHQSPLVRKLFIRYIPEGVSHLHLIRLPNVFNAYLSNLPAKNRRELERKIRRLREHGNGKLSLTCYRSSEDCDDFVAAAARVAATAWQKAHGVDVLQDNEHWRTKIRTLAEQGVLRSYILQCGNTPCAAEFACCFNGVFHGILTYYDPAFAKFSPGAAMLYLYLQDLIEDGAARLVSLGSGDFSYKRWFGNVVMEDGSIFLFRRNISNHVRHATHVALRSVVRQVKRRLLGRH